MIVPIGSTWIDAHGTTYHVVGGDRGDPYVMYQHKEPIDGVGGGARYLHIDDFESLLLTGMRDLPTDDEPSVSDYDRGRAARKSSIIAWLTRDMVANGDCASMARLIEALGRDEDEVT